MKRFHYLTLHCNYGNLVHFLPVAASFCESSFPAGRLTQMNIASLTEHNSLCVGKDSRNFHTSRTLNVHEK